MLRNRLSLLASFGAAGSIAVWIGVGLAACATAGTFRADIPRTWATEGLRGFELPLAVPEYSPEHVSEEYYYSLPVRPVYRSYPVYHPDREPDGYREALFDAEPEIVFDTSELRTEEDWVRAGALVFHQPIDYDAPFISSADVLDPEWYDELDIPLTSDGVVPHVRWVVRQKGRLEVGNGACAICHIRVMPDGSAIEGAQGNFPLATALARRQRTLPEPVIQRVNRALVAAPWTEARDPATMSRHEIIAALSAIPPGVTSRQGTSLTHPVKVPDLIGIRDRKHLDATGLGVHRGPADLMRYAAVNQTMDVLANYGGFIPGADPDGSLPAPGTGFFVGTADRYGDAELHALALYLYSLEPPPNPHPFDDLARRGQDVFTRERCGHCHTPPLYTNNMLVPAPGFDPPAAHRQTYDVMDRRVYTDPTLTLMTRRGTGYYKVPSLKGVWYRGPFEHNGSVATLEDWFDPARLRPDYVPTGLAPPDGSPRPIPGHPFGLALSDEDRAALIAFLKTL
jgi:hypothetical protein